MNEYQYYIVYLESPNYLIARLSLEAEPPTGFTIV